MEQQRENGNELYVPKIRRRPDHLVDAVWFDYVQSQFPKLSPLQYKLKRVGNDSMRLVFDLIQNDIPKQNAPTIHRVLIRGVNPGENQCNCDAFRLGVYGTCSHIEFAIAQLGHDHIISHQSERRYSEIFLKHGLRHEIVFQPAINLPRNVRINARRCFDTANHLILHQIQSLNKLQQRASDYQHQIVIDDEVFEHIAVLIQQQNRQHEVTALFPRDVHTKMLDMLLKESISIPQRDAAITAACAGRFLLFDTPGFGKRRTAIAAAEMMAAALHVRKVLVLTNTSLMQTWADELKKMTSQASQVIFGTPARRTQWYEGNTHYKIARYDDLPDDLEVITGKFRPQLIIFDESHTLKRHGIQVARVARRLPSEYLLVLSGIDPAKIPGPFLSFIDMIDPQRIGILEQFLKQHQAFDLSNNRVQYVNMGRIAHTLPQHFRRFDTTVYRKTLPPLVEHVRYLPITQVQAACHAELQNKLFQLVMPWKEAINEWKQKNKTTETTPTIPMVSALSTPSDHIKATNAETEKYSFPLRKIIVPVTVLHQIQSTIKQMLNVSSEMMLVNEATSSGCKIDVLQHLLLEHLETTETKTVVFAHEALMLDLASQKFKKLVVPHQVVNQRMTVSEQKYAIHQFHNDPYCRVLLADDNLPDRLALNQIQVIVHLDRPWNPDALRLRTEYVTHGSAIRPIHSYHLISYGTLEHQLVKLFTIGTSRATGKTSAIDTSIFVPSDLTKNESVLLLDELQRNKYFDIVVAITDQISEAPMVTR